MRTLDANSLENGNIVASSEVWTDYDGDQTYRDFTLGSGNPPPAANSNLYEPGSWRSTNGTGATTEYLHNDMLGTQRVRSTSSGSAGQKPVFTAFGERVDAGSFERFGYAGAWGYQDHRIAEAAAPDDAFPFQHVGARYYDPASGRFLQRDPIGLRGGLNVYSYLRSSPTDSIDPTGLSDMPFEHDYERFRRGRPVRDPDSHPPSNPPRELEVPEIVKEAGKAGLVGGAVGGAVGAVKGAVTGAVAGAPAGGVGAGPGAVAGGVLGYGLGWLEGFFTGVCGYLLVEWGSE